MTARMTPVQHVSLPIPVDVVDLIREDARGQYRSPKSQAVVLILEALAARGCDVYVPPRVPLPTPKES